MVVWPKRAPSWRRTRERKGLAPSPIEINAMKGAPSIDNIDNVGRVEEDAALGCDPESDSGGA